MKTVEEILKQPYLSAYDLQAIIPKCSYKRALQYIDDTREIMKQKGYFVPEGKMKIALTKIIKKRFGL